MHLQMFFRAFKAADLLLCGLFTERVEMRTTYLVSDWDHSVVLIESWHYFRKEKWIYVNYLGITLGVNETPNPLYLEGGSDGR